MKSTSCNQSKPIELCLYNNSSRIMIQIQNLAVLQKKDFYFGTLCRMMKDVRLLDYNFIFYTVRM